MSAPLLIHSLAEFRELIFACLDKVGPDSIVEVGAEDGTFTKELLEWARDHGARVTAVEPMPTAIVIELAETWPELHLVEERSPAALEHLEAADVYLIDGDHNYATLLGELRAIYDQDAKQSSLVFLHDVGWPSGRRDMYYDPASLPSEAVHPHTYAKGVVPASDEVVEGGFRGGGQFAWARREGGQENGVLTAVEDFLRDRVDQYCFVTVPCVFGLGVLFPRSAPWAETLNTILSPYDGNAILARLEQNRLSLYLAVLRLQDERTATVQRVEQLELERRDLDVENRALWARLTELEAASGHRTQQMELQMQTLRDELKVLGRSRAFAVAEVLSRARGLVGKGQSNVSRRRLRSVLEASTGS